MQAAWYEKQGAAQDVIQYGELPVPTPDPEGVQIRVRASGVNPSGTKVRIPRLLTFYLCNSYYEPTHFWLTPA